MGIKSFKPVTPSLRNMTVLTNDELTKFEPEKKLLAKVLSLRYNPIHDIRHYALPIHDISF